MSHISVVQQVSNASSLHLHLQFIISMVCYSRMCEVMMDTQDVCMLRAIDGFARSIDCAAPSMDPLIAHLSVDRASIDRSRNHRSLPHSNSTSVAKALLQASRFIHYNRMDPLFKEPCMTAIATAKAASTKICVLSQERFEAIVHHPSSPQDKVR